MNMSDSEENPKRRKVEDFFTCESYFNFSRVKSLHFMAAVRLILSIGDIHDITKEEEASCFKENLQKLPIPKSLYSFLTLVAYQIFEEKERWIWYLGMGNTSLIVWSNRGLIDCVATARNILSLDTYSDHYKFKLVCHFCMEEEVFKLAPKAIPAPDPYSDSYIRYTHDFERCPMLYVWPSELKSGIDNKYKELLHESFCQRMQFHKLYMSANGMVCYSLINQCRFSERALFFMWDNDKVETSEIESLLLKTKVSGEVPFEFFCHIYEDLSCDYHKLIVEDGMLIISLFDSHYCNDHFVPSLNRMWNFITPDIFHKIICNILYKMQIVCQLPCNAVEFYVTMFKKVWQAAPEHLKKFRNIIPEIDTDLIDRNFKIISQNLMLIDWRTCFDVVDIYFQNREPKEKKHALYMDMCIEKFKDMLLKDEWDILEKFLSLCLTTDEELDNFKEELVKKRVAFDVAVDSARKQKVDKIDRLMDWFFKTDKDKMKLWREIAVHCISFSNFQDEVDDSD